MRQQLVVRGPAPALVAGLLLLAMATCLGAPLFVVASTVSTVSASDTAAAAATTTVAPASTSAAPASAPNNSSPEPITITVQYESRCPDSLRFVRDQLLPAQVKLGDQVLKMDLLPFGKAYLFNASAQQMRCQHGPDECDGNRYMACVNRYSSKNNTALLEANVCLFGWDSKPEDCVNEFLKGVANSTAIGQCYSSNESWALMEQFSQRNKPFPLYVPKITINNSYSLEQQKHCQFDLVKCVCKLWKGPELNACKAKSESAPASDAAEPGEEENTAPGLAPVR